MLQLFPLSLKLHELCQNACLCFASRIRGLLEVMEFEVNNLEFVGITFAPWTRFPEYRN